MKITPMAGGTNIAGASLTSTGTESTSEARKAAATRAFKGETPISITESDTPVDPRISQAQRDIRRIKMTTNATPAPRDDFQPQAEAPQAEAPTASSDTPVEARAVEETKPLDPQQADLAKARRALQVRERAIAERERALEAKASQPDPMTRLKTNPLEVLQEAGVTYDQLTEAILANQSGSNLDINKIREEIKKEVQDSFQKTLGERDSQQEQQVFAEMKRNITQMVASNDDFELVRRAGMEDEALDLIRRTWKESGEALTEADALKLIEEELTKEYQSLSEAKKFKSAQAAPQPAKPVMRTLTSQGAATPQMSRRDRAIAAARGTLKR